MSTSSAANTACRIHPCGRTSRPLHRHLNPRLSAAVLLGLLCCNPAPAATDLGQDPACQDNTAEPVRIRHVHDGDTVVRADGERIRLIGIDTPELARDERPAEAGSLQARDRLRTWIANADRITARYGRELRDKYGRLLAHLYADDRNLQAELLAAGLATPLFISPNLAHVDCYQQAALMARRQGLGLWHLPQYRPREANSLTGNERGYHVVTGMVQRVGHSRSSVWLNLGPEFALRIERDDLPLFEAVQFDDLAGTRVQARGYLYRRNNQLRMRLRHPADMEIVSGD